MVWVLIWAVRTRSGKGYDVAQFGIVLALLFLAFGAVLGVLLGLQLADVEVVAPENSERLAGGHPGAMVIGFVVLAGVALIEWLIQDRPPRLAEARWGVAQMVVIFLAGLSVVLGFLLDIEPLLTLGVPLQIVGTIILLVRHRSRLAPSQWSGSTAVMVRTAVIGLVAVVAFIAYLVPKFTSGADIAEFVHILLAMDHTNFLLVMTLLIFAMMARRSDLSESRAMAIYIGVVVGAVGFVFGLVLDQALLKRIFTPILGVALLYGIVQLMRSRDRSPAAT
jgi:hypothetical protein